MASENNGILIGEDDVTLSIPNPEDSNNPLVLNLNHYRHWKGMGYSREPIAKTMSNTTYSPLGVPVSRGMGLGWSGVKNRFFFDVYLSDEELLTLQGILAISEELRPDVSQNHQITLLDNRQLYQELGNTNTRFLAAGSVDNSTRPGFARYFAGFYVTFERIAGIFNIRQMLAGRAMSWIDGTVGGDHNTFFPVWNAVFTMVEGDKLTP